MAEYGRRRSHGEMAEYGRRRSPAKRVYWETGIEGSNPSLSVNTKGQ